MRPMTILGTGTFLPELTVDNHQMSGIVDTSDAWILSRTGISSRHLTAGESTSDMGESAARKAIEAAGIATDEISAIIVTTLTPDHFTPATACVIQARIGAKNAFCYDLNAACTGFVYAFDVASRYLLDPEMGPILIISSETLSKIVDYSDRTTCVLFGDAASAVVVARPGYGQPDHSQSIDSDYPLLPGVLSSFMRAEGESGGALVSAALPVRHPFLAAEDIRPDPFGHEIGHYLSMNGQDVFRFAVRALADSVRIATEKAGLSLQDIDWIVPHQANSRIMDAAVRRLQVAPERVISRMSDLGNTSSASIPICLDELVRDGRLKKGQIVAITGFGGGLTYGASVFRY